jgi:hypothetical protein
MLQQQQPLARQLDILVGPLYTLNAVDPSRFPSRMKAPGFNP